MQERRPAPPNHARITLAASVKGERVNHPSGQSQTVAVKPDARQAPQFAVIVYREALLGPAVPFAERTDTTEPHGTRVLVSETA